MRKNTKNEFIKKYFVGLVHCKVWIQDKIVILIGCRQCLVLCDNIK